MHLVFVYGTLRAGEPNHRLLRGAEALGPDRTRPEHELANLGPFPALVAGGTVSVHGEVYRVDAPTLARLDALEGCPTLYQRERLQLLSGRWAWVYVMRRDQVAGRPRIRSGDWRQP